MRIADYGTPFQFPAAFTLAGHSYVLVHTNAAGTSTGTDLYPPTPLAGMGNVNGSVSLCYGDPPSAGNFIDFVQYGDWGETWESTAVAAGIWTEDDYVTAVDSGHSMGRDPSGQDTNEPEDWAEFYIPTGGSDNEHIPTPTPLTLRVNGQPSGSTVPTGFYRESCEAYSIRTGPQGDQYYGWQR